MGLSKAGAGHATLSGFHHQQVMTSFSGLPSFLFYATSLSGMLSGCEDITALKISLQAEV